jgi:hypothetical protein
MSAERINGMIQDFCMTAESMAVMRTDSERLFADYGLSEDEKATLRSCNPVDIVTRCGVHPILAFHYLFAVRPEVMETMSLKGYPALTGGLS